MSLLMRNMVRMLNEQDMNFDFDEDTDTITMQEKLGKINVDAIILICGPKEKDEHTGRVQIFIFDFCPISDISISLYDTINHLNETYRWFRTYINMDKHRQIVLSCDAIVDIHDPVDEIIELVIRGAHVAEEIYPQIMKVIWR